MRRGLSGRVALVTGGTKGIGLACARTLTSEGVRVAVASREPSNVASALSRIPGAIGVAANFTGGTIGLDGARFPAL